MLAALLSGHLAKYTKEALLSSPAFCRFAQESSRRAHGALNEAMRSAQPVIEKAVERSQQTIRPAAPTQSEIFDVRAKYRMGAKQQKTDAKKVDAGEHFSDFSVLEDGLKKVVSGEKDCWRLLADAAADNQGCGAAMAAMLGLAIGDAVGAPLEFLPVNQLLPDHLGGYSDARRPCVLPPGLKECGDKLQYRNPYNKFQLLPGQWTDDTSMALCLADSLLVSQGYSGADVRVRWHMWWFQGYCNAFRHDGHRRYRTSVGLGGNVSKSLAEVERLAARDGLHSVPPIYGSVTNDAGNGSIMRLAPVPIAYYLNPVEAMEKAILQSRATHPSCDAAACCAFMAFFIAKAIRLHSQGLAPACQDFIASAIPEFLASGFQDLAAFRNMAGCGRTDGVRRIRALLTCAPPSPKEASWDWKSTELQIWEAMKERWKDRRYNGHPIIDTYWGAYCMDGLAMALWALWHTDCWYGLSVSLGWGCLGALVSVYGLMKGVKLRHPKLKLGSGIDVSLAKYLFFVTVTGNFVSLVVAVRNRVSQMGLCKNENWNSRW
ncbi:tri1 [Symbiodinium sp. CCMP2592]|nr:tri1 [Symbiodinium sp. CCMP2592]